MKVLIVKLKNAEKRIINLLSERAVMKTYVPDVNVLLLDTIETRAQ